MTKDGAEQNRVAELRKRAEARRKREAMELPDMAPEEVRKLVHELETHQIELEMQNEELRRTQEELIESRDRYSNLYNFAPVGYVTVGYNGLIIEANLTLAEMLGVERRALVNCPISAFIIRDDQDVFYRHRREILASKQRDTCQIRMLRRGAEPFWAEMDSIPIEADDESDGRVRASINDISERRQAEEALSHQATRDALTGLINRGEFERRLGRVLSTAHTRHDEHAICYLDLDQFKVINDTCGHMAGDELLRQLGQLLLASVRKRDTLARLGGDEFGMLLERCTVPQALRVATNVRRTVAGFRFAWEGRVFRIGVSIGLVPITAACESVSDLLSAADSACYKAKDEGRNRVHVYHLGDTDLARRQGQMRWVGRIDQALEDERLQLWSQPIVPIMMGPGVGEDFEMLLRLVDERGETRLPEDFLPAAERYGLSTKLDCWVISATFSWLSRNPKLLGRLHLCFINLSGASLADEGFLEFVHEQLEQSQVPAQKICFEVTETAAMTNMPRAITFMGALKEQGCRFALDDFGSGWSSFAYLKTLPVDYLKIYGEFIKDILDDEVNLALVRSINDVGKVMGMRTIAESVENGAILEQLRTIGVDYAQGYGVGQPAPVEETTLFEVIEKTRHRI